MKKIAFSLHVVLGPLLLVVFLVPFWRRTAYFRGGRAVGQPELWRRGEISHEELSGRVDPSQKWRIVVFAHLNFGGPISDLVKGELSLEWAPDA